MGEGGGGKRFEQSTAGCTKNEQRSAQREPHHMKLATFYYCGLFAVGWTGAGGPCGDHAMTAESVCEENAKTTVLFTKVGGQAGKGYS